MNIELTDLAEKILRELEDRILKSQDIVALGVIVLALEVAYSAGRDSNERELREKVEGKRTNTVMTYHNDIHAKSYNKAIDDILALLTSTNPK